jgi:hypothetical protein
MVTLNRKISRERSSQLIKGTSFYAFHATSVARRLCLALGRWSETWHQTSAPGRMGEDEGPYEFRMQESG